MKKYNIAVIGAGSAGLAAARLAAKFGVSVVLFENNLIGGDCLNTGCVPSKSIITAARDIHKAQNLQHFGVKASVKLDFQAIRSHIFSSIHHIKEHEDSRKPLEEVGVDVVEEAVTFTGKHTLESASGKKYQFKKCIIATGSSPKSLKIRDLKQEHIVTSDTIWSLDRLPRHLVIVGGGPVGLELGQAFAMLGSKVTILLQSDKLLDSLDQEVGSAIAVGLKEAGVNVLLNAEIEEVREETELKLLISSGTEASFKSEMYVADKVLTAIGRSPNTTGMGLDNARVTYHKTKGIDVDDRFRTANKNVYAVGDCTGRPYFTHLAAEQGATALTHALFGTKRKINWKAVPWVFFTTPEVAHVGASELELLSSDVEYETEILDYGEIDRAITAHQKGSVKILLDSKRKILGATIIGENAGELIGYYAYIMGTDKKLDSLAEPMQAYPTYAMALRQHASHVQFRAFTNTSIPKILLKLRGY
jgi:pyruvate/2-oxoglutarate dehydrogenase complex dihydrolipoamide dehydrogenase (E3) component